MISFPQQQHRYTPILSWLTRLYNPPHIVFHAIFPCIVVFHDWKMLLFSSNCVLKTTAHTYSQIILNCVWLLLTFFIPRCSAILISAIFEIMQLQSRQEFLIQCDYFPSDLADNSSSKLRHLRPYSSDDCAVERHCFRWYVVTFITTQPGIIVGR